MMPERVSLRATDSASRSTSGTTALIGTLRPSGNQGAACFYTHRTIFTDRFDG